MAKYKVFYAVIYIKAWDLGLQGSKYVMFVICVEDFGWKWYLMDIWSLIMIMYEYSI